MTVPDILAKARDTITVTRVFAEPVDRDGATVIAAAAVSGGAGGGDGTDTEGEQGSGGGFGARARPIGAFVLTGEQVHWHPAVDVTRVVTIAGAIAITALLVAERIVKLSVR